MEMRREFLGFGVTWEIKKFITPSGITLDEVYTILKHSDRALFQKFFQRIAWNYYSLIHPGCYKY